LTTDNAPVRFRKKPVVIEAIQWTGENADEVQAFLHNGHAHAADGWVKGSYVEIGTLEGLMVASIGDWIIRGVKGEHYPCKPEIFAATYESADCQTAMSADAEFQITQDGIIVAAAEGTRDRAWEEIQHYAAVYSQDGPVEIWEVTRRRIEGSHENMS